MKNEEWNSFVNFYCVHEHNQMWHISKWWENEVQWTLKKTSLQIVQKENANEKWRNEQWTTWRDEK
jgi:hypothetical protein